MRCFSYAIRWLKVKEKKVSETTLRSSVYMSKSGSWWRKINQFGKERPMMFVKISKYVKSNIPCWYQHFGNRTWSRSWTHIILNKFITSAIGSVCPKLNLLVIWDLMTVSNRRLIFTQVLFRQSTGNSCHFFYKVCGSAAGLRSKWECTELISKPNTVLTDHVWQALQECCWTEEPQAFLWALLRDWRDGLL